MTEQDKCEIADKIISELKGYKADCPHGITAETAIGLRDFVKTFNQSKKTVVTAFTWTIVVGTIGLVVTGLIAKLTGWLK